MEEFLRGRKETDFKSLTGLSFDTFRCLFKRYCGSADQSTIKHPSELYDVFFYLKSYRIVRSLATILKREQVRSSWLLQDKIKQNLQSLANFTNELEVPWNNRNNPSNAFIYSMRISLVV